MRLTFKSMVTAVAAGSIALSLTSIANAAYKTKLEAKMATLAKCHVAKGKRKCNAEAKSACATAYNEAFQNTYTKASHKKLWKQTKAETRAPWARRTANGALKKAGMGSKFCYKTGLK